MKIQKLASKMLKDMVREYHDSEKEFFDLDFFSSKYPDISDKQFGNALTVLCDDGFVSLLWGEGLVTCIALCPTAISNVEEDTLLKKGYELIKEVKSLID